MGKIPAKTNFSMLRIALDSAKRADSPEKNRLPSPYLSQRKMGQRNNDLSKKRYSCAATRLCQSKFVDSKSRDRSIQWRHCSRISHIKDVRFGNDKDTFSLPHHLVFYSFLKGLVGNLKMEGVSGKPSIFSKRCLAFSA